MSNEKKLYLQKKLNLCLIRKVEFFRLYSWPSSHYNLPENLKCYFKLRHDISVQEGILLYKENIKILLYPTPDTIQEVEYLYFLGNCYIFFVVHEVHECNSIELGYLILIICVPRKEGRVHATTPSGRNVSCRQSGSRNGSEIGQRSRLRDPFRRLHLRENNHQIHDGRYLAQGIPF